MWGILSILYLGYNALKEASQPTITMDYHSNVKLEKEDLDKMHCGEISQKEYYRNLNNGKYIQKDKSGKEFNYNAVIANINKCKEPKKSKGWDTGMEDHALREVVECQKCGMPMRDAIVEYWYDRFENREEE